MPNNGIAPVGFKRGAAVVVLPALAGVLVEVLGQQFLRGFVHVLSTGAILGVMLVVLHGGRDMSWRRASLHAVAIVVPATALAVGLLWVLSILRV
jgi:hypothetical protein